MFFCGAGFAVARGWRYPRSFSPATMVSGQKLNTEAISPAMQKPQSEQPLQPHKKSISKRTTYSICSFLFGNRIFLFISTLW